MKTNTSTVGIVPSAIIAVFAAFGFASAQTIDITKNDWSPNVIYGSDPRMGINESGETEAGTIADSSWDLRAMTYSNSNVLTIISGFNPLTRNGGFGIGDVFIDTNGSLIVPSRPSLSNGYYTVANSLVGYEYAIDMTGISGGSLTYNIVGLSATSTLVTGFYGQNAISDPASLSASPADLMINSSRLSEVTTKTDAEVLADLGINIGNNGGTNYVFSFDLSSIDTFFTNGATLRLTEECGNDLLVGYLPAEMYVIPELSSTLLASLGAVSVALIRRRR